MAILVVAANEKGGVAKTTTTLNLLTGLSGLTAMNGKKLRVLGLDCDPQGGLTFSFGINRDTLPASLYEVLLSELVEENEGKQRWKMQDVVVRTWIDPATRRFLDPTERVNPLDPNSPTVVDALRADGAPLIAGPDVAPISRAAINADKELTIDPYNWVYCLRDALAPIWDSYDYIIADTNPSAGCLTGLCLCTAPYFFVPLGPDPLSVQGSLNVMKTARQSKKRQNPGLELVGLLFTRVSGYKSHDGAMTRLRNDMAVELHQTWPDWEFSFFHTIIQQLRDGVEAAEARSAAIIHRPNSQHAVSYWCFLAELMEKVGGPAKPLMPTVLQALQEAEDERLQLALQRKEERGMLSGN
jgi:chromosome partitioning protein